MRDFGGFFRRLIAFLIDLLIIHLITYLIYLSSNAFIGDLFGDDSASSLSFAYKVLSACFPALYFIFFYGNTGQSPGKAVLHLKVLRDSGERAGYGVAFLRCIGYFISLAVLGIGFIWIIFDSRKQGWHDKLAKTVVVKTDRYGQGRAEFIYKSNYSI
jgi:uncharacterized RDD family membrane protein YckC